LIKIECKNPLLSDTITNYLLKKNFVLSLNNQKYQTAIKITNHEKFVDLEINDKKKELSLPLDINLLFSQILKLIIDTNFSLGDFKYFPYQRIISKSEKKSLLSDIQNIIITALLLSNEGIDKEALYKIIWKKDKSIFINKLDTHLTNLKKKLKKDLDMNLNFQSQNKSLRLVIN